MPRGATYDSKGVFRANVFAASKFADLISNYELSDIANWNVTTLGGFLNSSAGPTDERLNSTGVDAVYVYDSSGSSWTTYINSTYSTYDFDNYSTSYIGYYVLSGTLQGKAIRHYD